MTLPEFASMLLEHVKPSFLFYRARDFHSRTITMVVRWQEGDKSQDIRVTADRDLTPMEMIKIVDMLEDPIGQLAIASGTLPCSR